MIRFPNRNLAGVKIFCTVAKHTAGVQLRIVYGYPILPYLIVIAYPDIDEIMMVSLFICSIDDHVKKADRCLFKIPELKIIF